MISWLGSRWHPQLRNFRRVTSRRYPSTLIPLLSPQIQERRDNCCPFILLTDVGLFDWGNQNLARTSWAKFGLVMALRALQENPGLSVLVIYTLHIVVFFRSELLSDIVSVNGQSFIVCSLFCIICYIFCYLQYIPR
jgi:hypothetical protein